MLKDDNIAILREKVESYNGPALRIMEVCGTHTHENFRLGIRSLLPENIKLIAGPGCPVCVTPASYIDEALYIAEEGAVVCSFGDLLRVPGSGGTLANARARGADIRVVYSPLDALTIAKENPQKEVVFLAVGFETTTPISCIAAKRAHEGNINNFSLLTANKTMTNAYYKLADSADAFLYPGHVSVITGTGVYEDLKRMGVSGVVAGFTASELLLALAAIIEKSALGKPYAINCYTRVVTSEGNPQARAIVDEIMEPCDAIWRGLGEIEGSGMMLREHYEKHDARLKFAVPEIAEPDPAGCRCGDVLRGRIEPKECPLFGVGCTTENPHGACMVSAEGACAAFYKYGDI
jgi:hydrogenase expression/formation protein HypD